MNVNKIDSMSPKLKQLTNTAETLFSRYGIRRVSIEEICRTAKVSKVTFYKFFRNKNAIVLHILDTMFNDWMAQYGQIITAERPYPDRVRQIIDMKLQITRKLSADFIREYLQTPNEEIAAFIKQRRDEMMQRVVEDFAKAREKGEIRADIRPEFIIYFMNQINIMAADPQLVALYSNYTEMVAELVQVFFYGILPVNETEAVR
jgi:AcrR family transcriptional regulator